MVILFFQGEISVLLEQPGKNWIFWWLCYISFTYHILTSILNSLVSSFCADQLLLLLFSSQSHSSYPFSIARACLYPHFWANSHLLLVLYPPAFQNMIKHNRLYLEAQMNSDEPTYCIGETCNVCKLISTLQSTPITLFFPLGGGLVIFLTRVGKR